MAIPGPGVAINLVGIQNEFGGTNPISMSEYVKGGLYVPNTPLNSNIPTSLSNLSMSEFYNSSKRIPIPLTISASTNNYCVYANRGASYVAGLSDITVTVNPGVTVGSASTGSYSMLVPASFNASDTVKIVNNGKIQGAGGNGGGGGPAGARGSAGFVYYAACPGGAGVAAGNAVYVNRPTTITNNGSIYGGGGGGGGGGGAVSSVSYCCCTNWYYADGGAGGGGSGTIAGSGGSSTAGGAGAPGGFFCYGSSGGGGAGGGYGAAGVTGSPGSGNAYNGAGGAGGAAGKYIVGNAYVTWPAIGTRAGGVA